MHLIMPSCVVRGCVCTWKKRDPSIILHCFPKEPEKIRHWLQQTGQYITDQYDIELDKMVEKVYLGKVCNSYRMCSLHFTTDSYYYDGDRKLLRKDAVPSVFNKIKPSTGSGLSSTSNDQHIRSALPAGSHKPSITSTTQTYRVPVHNKASSQPTTQKMTLVPVVPQHVLFQACRIRKKSNSDRSFHTYSTSATTFEDMQKHSALSCVSLTSSVLRPSASSVLEVPVSLSSVQQNTPAISEYTVSPHSGKLKKPRPASTAKTLSSTKSSCPTISLSSVSSPGISNSGSGKSPYKTLTASQIPLTVGATQPCSMTVLPVSGIVSSVTQTSRPTSGLAQKPPSISVVNIPLDTPSSQPVIPGCQPPSKKRKLEENIVFFDNRNASSYGSSVLPSHCMSQTSNAGKLYFVSTNAPLVQPTCLIQKPKMVDKGVNTDFLINRKGCCCFPADSMHRKRNAQTQTKIHRKHCKIMCSLVPSEPANDLESTLSHVSTEDVGFSDCSSSRSSDCGDDPYDILENVNLDFVKVEVLEDSEIDISEEASSHDYKQEVQIKEETESSAGHAVVSPTLHKRTCTLPDFDISTVKLEQDIKTEEDQFQISSSIQKITNFVPQIPKIERTSPIPNEPLARVWRNPTSWETSAIQTDGLEDLNDSSFYINEMSEDEDESFLLPSDAEDEDDIKPVFQDLDSPVENPVEEEKYIVFESCLKKLIMMIPCRSETKCMSPLTQYRKETIGSYLSIEVRCRSGHTSLLWESQPRHGYQPMGNVLLSAAVLFSGSSFLKSQHMFKLLNLKSIDKSTYSKTQSMYLFPTINHHWKEEQKAVIQSVQERPLCLAGDQQLDNPGFSARYSIYSMMDVASKKICSFSVQPVIPQVTLEDLEKIGFQKSMGELQTLNAEVEMIVTDRSVAIQELLKNNYPGIIHQLDLWHLSKSVGNEVLMAAKHKDCEILYEWVEAIRNHIWWSSCTCCKNPDLLIEKWKSVLQHVTNVHEWGGNSDCKACHHPPLPEEVVNSTNWLKIDSTAHEQLKKIVENTSLLKDLKHLSFLCHTGELEIYLATCLKYRPKTLHFFLDSMVARTQLAALDHNRNVCRVKEFVKNASSGDALSTMTQGLKASKGQKSWILKALYQPICQHFLFDIMNDVIAFVKEEKTFQ
ncbi:uncharacterized protein LOC122920577 isoform X1 [Bufo gargarizans]|uniref:uncharacterized protein LOC122920577 isoform X1 n=2 Tax=Bufo gargarizans TaxID=30331 RepID=UPI001CF5CB31|nr:uncharacterized protein LOC122920577 isoform X1 [Bufo gargarizans]